MPVDDPATLDRIPHMTFDDFRNDALAIVKNGGKVVHYFAWPHGDTFKLMAVLRKEHLLVAGCDAPDR